MCLVHRLIRAFLFLGQWKRFFCTYGCRVCCSHVPLRVHFKKVKFNNVIWFKAFTVASPSSSSSLCTVKYLVQVWKCPKTFNSSMLIICVFIYFQPPHLLSPSSFSCCPVTNRSHLLRVAWWCTCGPPPQALSPTPSRDQSCRSISLSSSAPPLTPILAATLPTPPLPPPPSPLSKGQRMAWRWATHCKYR